VPAGHLWPYESAENKEELPIAGSDYANGPRDGWVATVFAKFEQEILRERIRAGIAEARLKGKTVWAATDCGKEGWPALEAIRIWNQHGPGLPVAPASGEPQSGARSQRSHKGINPILPCGDPATQRRQEP
jgi:hypothetical protein